MTEEELNARFGQLVDAQLQFQSQLGDLARIFREKTQQQDRLIEQQDRLIKQHERLIEQHEQLIEKHEQDIQAQQQRQAESDERFNVLLQEIRFLIRQQQPPPESDPSQ